MKCKHVAAGPWEGEGCWWRSRTKGIFICSPTNGILRPSTDKPVMEELYKPKRKCSHGIRGIWCCSHKFQGVVLLAMCFVESELTKAMIRSNNIILSNIKKYMFCTCKFLEVLYNFNQIINIVIQKKN